MVPMRIACQKTCSAIRSASIDRPSVKDKAMSDGVDWLPFGITPEGLGIAPTLKSLCSYLDDTENIDKLLIDKKALIFRRFGISARQLEKVTDLLLRNRLPYVHGNSPRTKVGNNIYTSTEYPPDHTISMHNELSYAAKWP